MTGSTYILRRGASYYARIRVPLELVTIVERLSL